MNGKQSIVPIGSKASLMVGRSTFEADGDSESTVEMLCVRLMDENITNIKAFLRTEDRGAVLKKLLYLKDSTMIINAK
jgi:hypothetical protein